MFDNCINSTSLDKINHYQHFYPSTNGYGYDCWKLLAKRNKEGIMVDRSYIMYQKWMQCRNMIDRSFLSENNSTLSDWEMSRMILQVFLNPKEEVRQAIQLCEQVLFTRKHKIGLQLRFGGKRAATNEKYEGVPWERIPDIVKQIEKYMIDNHYSFNDTLVFVSSDSSEAVNEIRSFMNPSVFVFDSPLFSYGHSNVAKSASHISVVNRIMADIYFMERCDFVFVTWQSSLGRIMCNMMEKKQMCGKVLNSGSIDKRHKMK